MPPPRNGRYNAGAQSAQIEAIAASLERIEGKLDVLATWQISTESRLATGAEKFVSLERAAADARHKLESRDNIQVVLSLIAAAVAAVAGTIIKPK